MAAPNKKIRLTFLWADEAAVVQDFNAGYSKKLVEWADAFYKRFGFELDVQPAPGGKAEEAYRYALARSKGYEPDHNAAVDFAKRLLSVKKPVLIEWLDADKQIRELEPQEEAKRRELGAALAQFVGLPLAQWQAQLDKAGALFAELQGLAAKLAAQRKRYADMDAKLEAIDQQYAKEKEDRDFDVPVRLLIGAKVLASLDLSLLTHVKTGAENDAIVDPYRLKIIFCRFKPSAAAMMDTMRPTPQPFGFTLYPIDFNTVGGQYLWNGGYIMINVLRQEQITLAHEVVHAAGRHHRDDFEKMKDLQQYIRQIAADPVTGQLVLPSLYERADGGYYDGPDDDIINYKSKGKKPDQVTLYPDDQKRMADAFFVKEPPASP